MLFKVSKEPTSLKCTRLFFSSIKDTCIRYGLDYDKILLSAEQNRFNYGKFAEDVKEELTEKCDYLIKVLDKQCHGNTREINSGIIAVTNAIDAVFTFRNSPRLIYENDELTFEKFVASSGQAVGNPSDFSKCLDDMDDFILDFKNKAGYWNVMVRFCKCDYTITCHKGENLPVCSVAILSVIDNKTTVLGQFLVVDGIFPNLLIEPSATQMPCQIHGRCKRSVNMVVSVKSHDGLVEDVEFCYMTQKKIREGVCSVGLFNPYVLLQIAAYVWDMYSNRHTLMRKNSRRHSNYKQHAVNTIINDDKGGYSVLPVHKYYEYEREHREWQGGHHNSPMAHDRREHKRVLRNPDGSIKKIVSVKACHVNGNEGKQAYYRVKQK
ncbi:MAG: hypothetical protein NC393_04130 [Clostridium sp.]|nr:hypothetical protein [Clostridium sp.]MCM1208963.1 hypothetical protein [Ruminococcus sp.]